MSLSIGSTSGMSSAMMGMGRVPPRPDPSQMVSDAFSKLDTTGKGYIDKTDLQNALSGLSSDDAQSGAVSADELFSALDGDSDGKVTQSEMSETLSRLADELDAQFNSGRMSQAMGGMGGPGVMGGMPPPSPPGDDEGIGVDQLSQMASDAQESGDSKASELSALVENFDEADTNQDGKLSFQEAMAYKEKTSSDAAEQDASTNEASATRSAASNDAVVMHRMMQLLASYRTDSESVTRGTSVSAAA